MSIVPKAEPQDAVLPPPASAPPPPQKPAPDAKQRDAALKEISDYRRVTAWPIHRWPLEKRIVQTRTRVHLPRTYRARHGSDVRTVYPGTDVNQFVHRHYSECKERWKREEWPNYVAGEAILAKRHEYLGPDPRVAGYVVDADGEYHIKWYDAFLKDQWVDNQKWSFDVRLDASGNWVEVDDVTD
ncbi:hypothetical protein BV20DRAFT_953241 [Pilatotrama ljubarskyi]|nr:hypothetical protein BV20DRAFT_953241 [Pilatotrama ljubarskyi]